ncbi:transcriptional regulator [Pseudoclavibacter sp. AY1F1]|uniref:MerR family transcriptional regulator n=1 Tax=Pseudoclavibacter sp. AY1F1 TaxID=2080583 RepID=UPI000CE88566|nr:MerR family transcriptional regulator [Pseudoclavibacter sp. AY1F1]PPF43339.1 transcriptional regulator [Pseudoclavibacter sp. AY1F1]
MRISEVSRRSGISATALRYYESIGLVTPHRSSNGYRDYDATTLHRLDLIEASKELGLPLADISRHLASLEVDSCTDVREQLRPLLAERVRQIDEKRARLDELRARLTAASHGLVECPDRDDRCSTECIFRTYDERAGTCSTPSE